ncbi:probable deoxyuridine 5'-triphosphate nucleotidohydrolase [Pocillopora damicornis]|uniref:probable deoxyuridine 5'-triphosphate nucleotidohydrolase n=1 Tax=Pocillopora damicornis TaxID=46731 RepID=UPI000F553480|nr:probable deoxyuridine 5'-triphosphate nucleotidohydrolase [Pocillopora damicornis]
MGQFVSTALTALGYPRPSFNDNVLLLKKISDRATTPSRGSDLAAGYDLYSAENVVIPKQGKALVKTDIAIALPEGCYGRVAPRSSLSWKHHIDVGAGVVDRDYRGNVGVVLFNLSQMDYEVQQGDRIAQLIIERISNPPLVEVKELDNTARGTAGYGSTGK